MERFCSRCQRNIQVDIIKTGPFICNECKDKKRKKIFPKKCVFCGYEYSTNEPVMGRPICDKCKERFKNEEYETKKSWTEFIVCPLCLRDNKNEIMSRIQYITFAHLKTHGYTNEKFKLEFQKFKMKVESLCKQHSEALSGENHFNFGKHLSEITRNKIKNSNIEANEIKGKCKICSEEYSTIQLKDGLCQMCYALR